MWWLLKIIPFSEIFEVIAGYFKKKQEVDLEKYVQDSTTDRTQIRAVADVAVARADDPVDRWGRRLFVYPLGVWFTLIVYDSSFRELIPSFTWRVLALPDALTYIPYAVIGYLFITKIKQ